MLSNKPLLYCLSCLLIVASQFEAVVMFVLPYLKAFILLLHPNKSVFLADRRLYALVQTGLVKLSLVLILIAFRRAIASYLNRKWSSPSLFVSGGTYTIIQALLLFLMVYFTGTMKSEFDFLAKMPSHFESIGLLGFVHLPAYQMATVFMVLWVTQFIGVGIWLLSILQRQSLFQDLAHLLTTLAFILTIGYFSSYQKIDHTYSTLIYCQLGFSLRLFGANESQAVWASKLWVSACYALAAFEKIFFSPLDWVKGKALAQFLLLYKPSALIPLPDLPVFVASLAAISVLALQLGLAVFHLVKEQASVYLVAGLIGFHIATQLFMGIGDGLWGAWCLTLMTIWCVPFIDNKLHSIKSQPNIIR